MCFYYIWPMALQAYVALATAVVIVIRITRCRITDDDDRRQTPTTVTNLPPSTLCVGGPVTTCWKIMSQCNISPSIWYLGAIQYKANKLPGKNVPEMTRFVSGGTKNFYSINQSPNNTLIRSAGKSYYILAAWFRFSFPKLHNFRGHQCIKQSEIWSVILSSWPTEACQEQTMEELIRQNAILAVFPACNEK